MKLLITLAIIAYTVGSVAWFMHRMGVKHPRKEPLWVLALDQLLGPPVMIIAYVMGALAWIDDKIKPRK